MSTNTIRLSYKKTFLTGILKGMTVDAGYDIPDTIKDRQRAMLTLLDMDRDNPGSEALTGNKFFVSAIYLS
jgi:hypothetical protein